MAKKKIKPNETIEGCKDQKFKIEIECKPHIELNQNIKCCCTVMPTDLTIIPIVHRYFYIPFEDISLMSGTTISCTQFTGDDGSLVNEFSIFIPNGYRNVYVNGVMQEGGAYTVSATELTFNTVTGTLTAGTPLVVEAVEVATVV